MNFSEQVLSQKNDDINSNYFAISAVPLLEDEIPFMTMD